MNNEQVIKWMDQRKPLLREKIGLIAQKELISKKLLRCTKELEALDNYLLREEE